MKPSLTIFSCFLTLWLFSGCDKGPELTPITQEGRNTFSCKVNGKVWVPDGRGVFAKVPAIGGGFYRIFENDPPKIWIRINNSEYEALHLHLTSIELGKRDLNVNTGIQPASLTPGNYGFFRHKSGVEYITSIQNTGWINLTRTGYLTDGIISGTFEFTASDQNGSIIHITDGRFDININSGSF